jgi:AsmA protein
VLSVATTPAEVSFDGQLDAGASAAAVGKLDLKVTSIRGLAAWLAEPIAFAGDGLNSLRIAGELDAGPQTVALTDATVALDAIEGTAQLRADIAGAIPKIAGQLDLGAVDLAPYLPPAERGQSAPAGSGGGGWSKEPIALPPLGGAEVDFALSLQSLAARGIQLGKTALTLKLADGSLRTVLKEMALYGGSATGAVTVAAPDGVAAITETFQLDGLDALPFLTAVAGFDRLEGKVDAKLDLTTRGGSELQLVQGLNGQGSFAFADGALVGINIAAMVRNAADAFLNPTAGESRKTDFSELSATFDITNGILANDDLSMLTPGLRVSGHGQTDLPARTVSYVIEPKAAATLEGQSGSQDVAGVLVPVLIQGPWDNLTYTPDPAALLDAALKSPETIKQLGNSAKDLKRALEKGGPGALIEGLTGSSGGDEADPVSEGTKKLLKGLFDN